jgi:hypothetical protein
MEAEQDAAIYQDKLGWTNFMLGRLSPKWGGTEQQMYYDWLGPRKTGKRWLVALTVKLLNIS